MPVAGSVLQFLVDVGIHYFISCLSFSLKILLRGLELGLLGIVNLCNLLIVKLSMRRLLGVLRGCQRRRSPRPVLRIQRGHRDRLAGEHGRLLLQVLLWLLEGPR